MPRVRLGVALLLPHPVATEVDGLRRALGDGALGRMPAHLTLVPPVNVDVNRLEESAEVLRRAGSLSAPLQLSLGPPTTFWPVTPVVYLAVGGDLEDLHALRDRIFVAPLHRRLTHDFVPHVTIAEELAEGRIAPAVAALGDYRAEVRIEAVHLLREDPGRRWVPIAEAPLGGGRTVGRGGLPLVLEVVTQASIDDRSRVGAGIHRAVVARRQGQAVGAAELVVAPDGALDLVALSVGEGERGTGVGTKLLQECLAVASELGCAWIRVSTAGEELSGFLRHRGFTTHPQGHPATEFLWRRVAAAAE